MVEDPIPPESLSRILESLFVQGARVFEAYSVPDQPLRSFTSPVEVHRLIVGVPEDKEGLLYLSIHYPSTGGVLREKVIKLDPKKNKGASKRYSIEGWGLVHFQLKIKNGNMTGRVSANSRQRANTWFSSYPELGSPEEWSWSEVEKQVRRIKREIKKGI